MTKDSGRNGRTAVKGGDRENAYTGGANERGP